MLKLLSSKAQGGKYFGKTSQPCHVCIHWKALAEHFHMSTHLPGFRSFFRFMHPFVLTKLATSSVRVKYRPITIWPIVKPWTHSISSQCNVTRRQTNEGSRICLHIRGSCSHTYAERTSRVVLINIWAMSHAKAFERDLLGAYPVMDIRDIERISSGLPNRDGNTQEF